MMKFKKGIVVIGIAALLIGSTFVFGAVGDNNDPLVSLSYLEDRLAKITGQVQSDKFVLLDDTDLNKGDIITGVEGNEIILRGGNASAYGVSKNNGLSNLTNGKSIDSNGTTIPANNHLLVPRDDGKGIKIESTNAWVMIKGEYKITR